MSAVPQAAPSFEAEPEEDQAAKAQRERQERLIAFGLALAGKRHEAIQGRAASGIEARWLEDLDAYLGRDAVTGGHRMGAMDVVRHGGPPTSQTSKAQPVRSTVFVQLTRQKTNAAFARLADMLYPNDDRNWAIKPTPVPELSKALQQGASTPWQENGQTLMNPQTQQPLTVAEVAADAMRAAAEKSQAMTREIEDALDECQYVREGRNVIREAAIYGTGILKGPFVVNRIGRRWNAVQTPNGPVMMMEHQEDQRPASRHVSVWDVFPDPYCADNVQSGSYIWEREYLPARELRKLSKVKGYLADQIRESLIEGPMRHTTEGSYFEQRRSDTGSSPAIFQDTRYELWTYVGEADRKDLEAAGVSLPPEDGITTYSAVIVLCNNRVIKALVNPLESGDFPYDFFVWEPQSLSPWGVGIPYLMRYAQKTINAAWRALLDNMAISAGPQIIFNRKVIEPADGEWEISPRKVWWAMKETPDVRTAMWMFNAENHIAEIERIIQLGMKFADDETAMPQIAQGEKGTAPDTVGGMTILMNSANAVLRRLVKQYDDSVTEPHIRRYYDWMMAYSPKTEIKGDFQCIATGSSSLIERDSQTQGLQNILALTTNPRFALFFDDEKLVRKAVQASRFTAEDVMAPEAVIKQRQQAMAQQKPPPDPRIEVANINAQAKQQQLEATLAADREQWMAELAQELQITTEELRVALTTKVMEIRSRKAEAADGRAHQAVEAERGRQYDQFNRAADRQAATQE